MTYDGPRVYRAPYGNDTALDNFENTVLEGVRVETVREHADDPPTSNGRVHIWGTGSSNDGTWSDVDPDDYLIFYRDDTYTHSARVRATEQNASLARAVWPGFEEDPWDRIVYLDPPVEIDVPSAEIHDLAGYDIDYTIGFSPLNDMGIGGIRGKYGSVEAFAEGRRDDKDRPDEERPDEDDRVSVDVHAEPDFEIGDAVFDGLYFPDGRRSELTEQVQSALAAGKHVVFTGPPGTGKTELARRICVELAAEYDGIYSGYQITTATADWSTFETVGGYMPTETDGDRLTFEPGQVLRRFKRDGRQRNELLVIDEINRADIDKAFGQLFTLLSGQEVQLPYRRDGEEIRLRPPESADADPPPHEYVVPASWRLLATMNTYDKTSLYELSYAFMRRFSFVHVDAPTVPEARDDRIELVRRYADTWELDPDERTLDAVSAVWRTLNHEESDRKIGPAIVRDMVEGIERGPHRDRRAAVTAAVGNYVLPQLEGTPRPEAVVSDLARLDAVDRGRLLELAGDFLQVRIDG